MILGADTGFFVKHSQNHSRVLQLWQELRAEQHALVLSALSINELLTHFLKRGLNQQAEEWFRVLTETPNIQLIPVTAEIASQSARYRLGLQLSTVDSIILTTCIVQHCDLLLTTDSDLKIAADQNLIPVEFLL